MVVKVEKDLRPIMKNRAICQIGEMIINILTHLIIEKMTEETINMNLVQNSDHLIEERVVILIQNIMLERRWVIIDPDPDQEVIKV